MNDPRGDTQLQDLLYQIDQIARFPWVFEAVKRFPQYADAFNDRGTAWMLKSDWAKVLADFGDAIRVDSTHAEALNNRAVASGGVPRLRVPGRKEGD